MYGTAMTTADGASARVEGLRGEERLSVRAPDGRVLFEYHADGSGRCVVYAPAKDLELKVEGRIRIEAGEQIELDARAIHVRADRWIERLVNAYREVEELSQTQAGRIRTLARETFQLLGGRVVLKAEGDMKVKGAKIHLA